MWGCPGLAVCRGVGGVELGEALRSVGRVVEAFIRRKQPHIPSLNPETNGCDTISPLRRD
jgi:hypothetical protein